jgi:hypothetical protein
MPLTEHDLREVEKSWVEFVSAYDHVAKRPGRFAMLEQFWAVHDMTISSALSPSMLHAVRANYAQRHAMMQALQDAIAGCTRCGPTTRSATPPTRP